jgi:hypothetical protein
MLEGYVSRLPRVISRILATHRTSGWGVVSRVLPGEVRLQDRPERVLVAGNMTPRLGERVLWLRVDGATLVTAKHVPVRPPLVLRADASGKLWQQVLVSAASTNFGVMLAHRDSSGRHWVKVRRSTPAYYSQECDDFLTPNWQYRGTGLGTSSEGGDLSTGMADGDAFVEVGQVTLVPLSVRRIDIDPDTGALSYGSAVSLPSQPEGHPFSTSICKDTAGYYHLVARWDYPYLTDPLKWREVCWVSDAPNSIASWTQNLNVLHEIPPDNWYLSLVLPVGAAVVKLSEWRIAPGDPPDGTVHYRVGAGGSWSATRDAGFAGWTIDGCGGEDLHITYAALDGTVQWRRASLAGSDLAWDDPVALLSSNVTPVGGVHRNYQEGSAPVAAWVSNFGQEFRRYGLPPGNDEEDLEPPDPLVYRITNGGLQAGGGMATPVARDGFAAFAQLHSVYAARIVEGEG